MIYIYCYENKINGKVYIGQTINFYKRHSAHINGNGVKNNSLIEKAMIKYGEINFDFWVTTIVDTKEQANQEEMYWIAEMRNQLGKRMVYNLTDGGEGSIARIHSDETKKKMSIAAKGKNTWSKGHILSPEHKEKLLKTNTGKAVSTETKNKIAQKQLGKPRHSAEAKIKIGKAHKGMSWRLIDGKRVWIKGN